jgi:hypothetical protein
VWVWLFLVLAGCAGPHVYLAKDYTSPQRIAVLPMANETNDLDGPPFVRQLIFNQLMGRGCDLVPLDQIDAKLKAQGFTEGGQLRAASAQQLGLWTGADGLFYGTLVNFSYINLGYYWQRKVTVAGRLVSGLTGEKLWESDRTWMTLNVVTKRDQATRQFFTQLAAQAMEKALHVPLQAESRIAVERLLRTLPHR